MLLFTELSVWTMVHGIALGGAALIGLAAAWFYLYAASGLAASPTASRTFTRLTALTAVALWLTVLVGTYVVFPAYRAAPPAGAADLSAYPRALLLADPGTAWLHAFGMEIKEHAPWIAAMLATAVAFVSARYRSEMLADPSLRRLSAVLLAISFGLVAAVSLLGVLVNKVAPLQ